MTKCHQGVEQMETYKLNEPMHIYKGSVLVLRDGEVSLIRSTIILFWVSRMSRQLFFRSMPINCYICGKQLPSYGSS